VKREFVQDNSIDEIRARIEDLEHAAQVLVSNTEQQAKLARELLVKKQAEHHVVAKKQLIQHKHDADLLSLMKQKVDKLLNKARAEAKKLYADGRLYNPANPPAAAAAPAPAPAAAAAPKAAAALVETDSDDSADEEEVVSFLAESEEAEQQIMVDASGSPVLPTSESIDLNAPLEPGMTNIPTSDLAAESVDRSQEAPLNPPRFAEADDEAEAETESSADEFGSVSPVEQAEIPTPESIAAARFAQTETEAETETFQPEVDAESQLESLPLEAELV